MCLVFNNFIPTNNITKLKKKMSFVDKVVLITGAGSGIGKGIALHFAKLSAKLSLISTNPDRLNQVAKECENLSKIKVFVISTDLGDTKNVKKVVDGTIQQYGRIDVVVNCAGRSGSGSITSPDLLDVLNRVIDVNLISPIALTHYASEALIDSKGCVINISSVIGSCVVKGGIPYAVSKAGIIHFTKCAALELAEKGVRVNCISPGPVNTNLFKNILETQEENDAIWNRLEAQTPLQRLVKAEEIAEIVGYLASDKAKSITGIDYIIDSGLSLQANEVF